MRCCGGDDAVGDGGPPRACRADGGDAEAEGDAGVRLGRLVGPKSARLVLRQINHLTVRCSKNPQPMTDMGPYRPFQHAPATSA
jgi:hypothetical protein